MKGCYNKKKSLTEGVTYELKQNLALFSSLSDGMKVRFLIYTSIIMCSGQFVKKYVESKPYNNITQE